MCRYWFEVCINASGSSSAQQYQCRLARDEQCGNGTVKASTLSFRPVTLSSLSIDTRGAPTGSLSLLTSTPPNAADTSSSSSTSAPESSYPSDAATKRLGVSGGTIAGAVVGSTAGVAILAALAWLWIRPRQKSNLETNAASTTGPHYDEKQVAEATTTALSLKPELHGESSLNNSHLSQAVDHSQPSNQYSYPSAVELPSTPQQHPLELSASHHQSTELQGSGCHNTVEQHSQSSQPEIHANIPACSPAPVSSHHYQPLTQPYQHEQQPKSQPKSQPQQEFQEVCSSSPVSSRSVVQRQLSSDEISALEEEERRIDTEMEEVRRMKELRDQKLAVQQKLREAKGI